MAPNQLAPLISRIKRRMASSTVGRPSGYDAAAFPPMALGYALLGATDRQLASLFNVSTTTLRHWIDTHPKFREAVEQGSTKADLFVATAFYRQSIGFGEITPRLERETRRDPNGRVTSIERIIETETYYPPDAAAAAMWLRNCQGGEKRRETDPDGR